MVFIALHISFCSGWLRRQFHLIFLQLQTWQKKNFLKKYQLDEIAAWVTRYRVDGIVPESFLRPTFLKYFPMVMEPGVLTGVNWNNISGLFVQSPVLPMTYVDNDVLLAMSKQRVWEADTPEGYHPRSSLAMVKLYPSAPVYALTTVYVPALQERLQFLTALTSLHSLQMEAAALIYMPKNCIYMPEPSSGNHFTLLPLARDKNVSIGALSSFTAAKLMGHPLMVVWEYT